MHCVFMTETAQTDTKSSITLPQITLLFRSYDNIYGKVVEIKQTKSDYFLTLTEIEVYGTLGEFKLTPTVVIIIDSTKHISK